MNTTGISKIACGVRASFASPSERWWRGWDSNPRGPCGPTSFQDWRFQPLSHPSDEPEAGSTKDEAGRIKNQKEEPEAGNYREVGRRDRRSFTDPSYTGRAGRS